MWEHLEARLVVDNDKIRDSDGQDHPAVQPALSLQVQPGRGGWILEIGVWGLELRMYC